MNVVGIIAEYNPFHNGHLYHLEQSKLISQSKCAVIVMSPNFVQRGSLAIIDKWTRTKMALLAGADLVIELPTPYATASAEYFAKASTALLHHTGLVNQMSFGSESNNLLLLKQIADILSKEPKEFQSLLKHHLIKGLSFPSARALAMANYCDADPSLSPYSSEIQQIIQTPNNILGIEYLKALNTLNSQIKPHTLQRKDSDYHNKEITGYFSSATAIRREIYKGHWDKAAISLPQSSYELLYDQDAPIADRNQQLSYFLAYRLLFSSPSQLTDIVGITEGIENRILKAFIQTQDIEEIIPLIKSKRFTQTAIQRMLLNIILQITKKDFEAFEDSGGPQYIRVLGFKKSSSYLLTQLKAKASLPLVMNLGKDYKNLCPLGQKMLDLEIRTTNLYASLQASKAHYNLDYTHPLVIL